MSALLNLSIDVANLPKEKFVKGKNGKVYYNFTVSINDETNQFGQNVSAFDSQTKEEREAKKQKTYLGNGKVVWTDDSIVVAVRQDQDAPKPAPAPAVETASGDDFPF
jgi:RNA binding exosome subunit